MTISTFMVTVLALLNLACIITVIFVERRNPSGAIAWVLVLTFIPLFGFIAYAILGGGFRVKMKKRYAIKQIADSLHHKNLAKYITEDEKRSPGDNRPHARLIRYLANDGEHYHTDDNAADIYTHGKPMFEDMKEDMRNAVKHIHLLYYIFKADKLGREIVGILAEKARSGVEVRVIYDSVGALHSGGISGGKMFNELRAAGGEVEAFSPLLLNVSSHLRINYRNHRKVTVIDGTVGYVGGMNIADEYVGANNRLQPWRDTQLRLTGSSVSFLQERFLMDWMFASNKEMPTDELLTFFPPPLQRGDMGVQIVSSGPDTAAASIKSGLLEMLYAARKNIYIQTPYFVPDESIMDALRIAASSGVDVRLMLPGLVDHHLVYWATLGYARQALDSGVKVYTYHGFMHAKTIVFDGAACSIGSANFDNRSFSLNFEVNAFIYCRNFAAKCEDIFLRDVENSTELREDWYMKHNRMVRGVFNACRLLAPLV